LGNIGVLNGALTDEPFLIARDETGLLLGWPFWAVILVEVPTDLTISGQYSCKIQGESYVKKIEPKFIPIPYFGEGSEYSVNIGSDSLDFWYTFPDNGYISEL